MVRGKLPFVVHHHRGGAAAGQVVPLAKVKGGSSATKPVRKGGGGSDSEESSAAGDRWRRRRVKSKHLDHPAAPEEQCFRADHLKSSWGWKKSSACALRRQWARCYNPNEETRLRAVIDAVGRASTRRSARCVACTTPSAKVLG